MDPVSTGPTNRVLFLLLKEKTVTTPFMRQTSFFKVAELPEIQSRALELPYKDHKFSLIIILPKEKDGLEYLEKR